MKDVKLFVHMFNKLSLDCYRQLSTEITAAQFAALRYLAQHQRNLLSDLAEGLNISNAAVTKMIDRLEKKALVQRVNYSGDRRATAVQLTTKGKNLLDDLRRVEQQAWQTILGRMSPSERKALSSGITAFIRAMLTDIENSGEVCLKCGIEHDINCPIEKYKGTPARK